MNVIEKLSIFYDDYILLGELCYESQEMILHISSNLGHDNKLLDTLIIMQYANHFL